MADAERRRGADRQAVVGRERHGERAVADGREGGIGNRHLPRAGEAVRRAAVARRDHPGERARRIGELRRDLGERARVDAADERPVDRREAIGERGDRGFGVGAGLGRHDPAHAAGVGEGAQTVGERGEVGIAGERQRRSPRGRGKRRGGAQGGEEQERSRDGADGAQARQAGQACASLVTLNW